MGKLENGKLTGGDEGESEDDIAADDDNAREMLELLRRGEVTNIGPETFSATLTPPTPIATSTQSPLSSAPLAPEKSPSEAKLPSQPAKPSKVSKFKLSLAQSQPTSSGTTSGANTPTDTANRSSPKLASPRGDTPIQANLASSSTQQPRFTLPLEIQAAFQNGELPVGMPGMIVDSPSFLPSTASVGSPLSAVSPSSTVVDTPTSALSTHSPVATDAVRETAAVPTPMRETVLERRPPTISSSRAQPQSDSQPRVSRFKAQRS